MTPEERFERIERQIEFLVNHQAQFFASLQAHQQQIEQHSEQIAKHSEQIAKNSEQIAKNSEQIAQLTDLMLGFGRIVEQLTQTTEQKFDGFDERLERLVEAQQRTDERLNVLINVVERYFSNGRGE